MRWPPGWAGFAINLGLLWGVGLVGWRLLVSKLKLYRVEMLPLFFSCLGKINCDRALSFCHKFPQMTSANQNLPSRMCEAPGIRCGWITSLAWLVPSFVCLPELSAPSALPVAKVKAEVSLSTRDLLCAAEIAHSILTGGWGLEEGVNSLWLKWIDKSWATTGMFMGINFFGKSPNWL